MSEDQQQEAGSLPERPSIPYARPAVHAGPWWSPRPLGRLEALGDVAVLAAIVAMPHLIETLVAGNAVQIVPPPSAQAMVVATVLMSATAAGLAIYLALKSRQPLSSIGLSRGQLGVEILVALMLTVLMFAGVIVTAVGVSLVGAVEFGTMAEPARTILEKLGRPSWWTILTLAASAAVFEEIIFRGFVLTRLRMLLGHWPTAIVVGSVLFALIHLWEGWWGAILVLPVALVLSIGFVLRRSLVAPMLAHFLFDFGQLALLRVASGDQEFLELLHPS